MRRRKRVRYFDLRKIEQGAEPLSPTEQEVRDRLAFEQKEQILSKLDLDAALQVLTPKQKAAFLLYADGHTEREIAEQLGLSRGNVHAYLEASRQKLKKILAP